MEILEFVKFVDDDIELGIRTDNYNDTIWLSPNKIRLLLDKYRFVIGNI